MYLAVHAAAGVAIHRSVGRVGIPLAVVSHPVLDRLPYWHNMPAVLPLEVVLNVLAIGLLWHAARRYRLGLLAGMAMDVEQIGKGLWGWPTPLHEWYWRAQWLSEPFWSVLVQGAVVLLVLWPFARPAMTSWLHGAALLVHQPREPFDIR
ncbi:MAG: hypothetical protein EPO21_07240 [Chloroflexota bacterium]|nr:MAG: hypothetical protein EPO21_07240 [Chloroflexota bacterium]